MMINQEVLLLDGPMGTEIDRRGGNTSLPLWSARALIEQPEVVKQIHLDYIKSGADIITTNTFRTQDWTIKNSQTDHQAKILTKLAVELAQEARDALNAKTLIAGSISPLEDCYSPELVPSDLILSREHKKMVHWLVEAKVDVLLIETMNTIREALTVVKVAQDFDIPLWLSLTCDDAGQILGGDSWSELVSQLDSNVDMLMVNCTSLEGTDKAINQIVELQVKNWGAYPNFGEKDPLRGWAANLVPEMFENYVQSWLKFKPKILGTCCGALPQHTTQLATSITKYTK